MTKRFYGRSSCVWIKRPNGTGYWLCNRRKRRRYPYRRPHMRHASKRPRHGKFRHEILRPGHNHLSYNQMVDYVDPDASVEDVSFYDAALDPPDYLGETYDPFQFREHG